MRVHLTLVIVALAFSGRADPRAPDAAPAAGAPQVQVEPRRADDLQAIGGADGLLGELHQLRRVDLLPQYRSGSSVEQLSSYDRTGGNDDGFAGTYSFLRKEGETLVIGDLEGPGVVHRIWTPTPTDRFVAFHFDGEAIPRLRVRFGDLFSGAVEPFVRPLVGNEVGGYFSYLPIPYARSLKIVYEGNDLRFHQIQYRRYPAGQRVESFHLPLGPDEAKALAETVEAWREPGRRPWTDGSVEVVERAFTVAPGEAAELADLRGGGRILGIELQRESRSRPWGADTLLEARWDGEGSPAIRSPVADFFGYAFGSASARALLLGSRDGVDYCYLPMPFDRSASIRLEVDGAAIGAVSGTARVFFTRTPRDPAAEGKLYAVWRRDTNPEEGQPYVLLDASGRGHYVGTILLAQGLRPGMTEFFEGDDVATVDGDVRLHGTGSEDYFNGGYYAVLDRWDTAVSLPLHGSLAYSLPLARTGGYRFYLSDKISFERDFRLTFEHGPKGNLVPVDYTSVAFYYSDRPPARPAERPPAPGADRRLVAHEFYPQLLSISLGSQTTATVAGGFLEISAEKQGLARIDVGAVPPGRYRVRVSFECGPRGAEFSLWRRQVLLSPWVSSFADPSESVERADLGEVVLTAQVRTLTIRTRSTEGRRLVRIKRLILEQLAPVSF